MVNRLRGSKKSKNAPQKCDVWHHPFSMGRGWLILEMVSSSSGDCDNSYGDPLQVRTNDIVGCWWFNRSVSSDQLGAKKTTADIGGDWNWKDIYWMGSSYWNQLGQATLGFVGSQDSRFPSYWTWSFQISNFLAVKSWEFCNVAKAIVSQKSQGFS